MKPPALYHGREPESPIPATISHLKDVDKDGDKDLVVKVFTEQMAISPADTEATLTGMTFGGTLIEGSDTIQVVP